MAKKTSENYLDNLLNSINGDNAFETEEDFSSDDFLREFENELVSEEFSNYMADFELEIEAERNKDLDLFVGDDKSEFDIEEFSLDDAIEKLEKQSVQKTFDFDRGKAGWEDVCAERIRQEGI